MMVSYHPHSQHLQWLTKIDYRTSIGRKFKKITKLSSRQCKLKLQSKNIDSWSDGFCGIIKNFIETEYPIWEEKQRIKNTVAQSKKSNQSEASKLIQKHWKGFYYRHQIKLRGLAFFNRKLCVNEHDFYSLEPIEEIPNKLFYSFLEDGKYYGFDVRSLLMLCSPDMENPYTRHPLELDVLNNFNNLITYLTTKHPKLSLVYPSPKLTPAQQKTQRVLALFQYMDGLDNYTDTEWYWNMSLAHCKRWYMETEDVWNYRAQLTTEVKNKIVPPSQGIPFSKSIASIKYITSLETLREIVLTEMERLVYSGIDRQHQILGAMYVLTGIVTVNYSAAQAMPWLIQP